MRPQDRNEVWCLVQGNPFGVLFQKSADNIGASFEHKGFDSSVIQVMSFQCSRASSHHLPP